MAPPSQPSDLPGAPPAEPGWAQAVDPVLVRRLMRPVDRPGVIDPRPAREVLARNLGMATALPLAERLLRRADLADAAVPGPPIVYARPVAAAPRPCASASAWLTSGVVSPSCTSSSSSTPT